MKKYLANIMINNILEEVEFDTDLNPIEFLWAKYGMDSYIERLDEVED